MVDILLSNGFNIILVGMDMYLVLVDFRFKWVKGNVVEVLFEVVGIICNKNVILFDLEKLVVMLGIWIGLFVGIICGFGEIEFV